jgi:hypothetical protein
MLAGLPIAAQATIVELLEGSGLPNICVTMALEEEQHQKLGQALAAAVKVRGELLG